MAIARRRRRGGLRVPRDAEGRMTLVQHLRELRSRLARSLLAIVAGMAVGLVFYDRILRLFTQPFRDTVARLQEDQGLDATINFDAIADPFTVPIKIALLTGLVLAAPVWIYQLWAFVVPALYRNERRYAAAVLLTATPLFLSGVALGYWLMPKGLGVILSFTPAYVSNIISFSNYLSFTIRLLVVFGIAFLLPVFVVLLNAVGVFTGARLAELRRWVVLGIFVFAAVATPTGDPVTMSLLAGPMWLLFEASVLISRLNDRRRARAATEPDYAGLGDDETSPLPRVTGARRADDDVPSRLDDDPS